VSPAENSKPPSGGTITTDRCLTHIRDAAHSERWKTGVTANRDKIEFRLFNSSSIFNITLREELLSSLKHKTNHTSLSCFHGASHLSQVPWKEVDGHYSPIFQGSCWPIPPLPLLTTLPVILPWVIDTQLNHWTSGW